MWVGNQFEKSLEQSNLILTGDHISVYDRVLQITSAYLSCFTHRLNVTSSYFSVTLPPPPDIRLLELGLLPTELPWGRRASLGLTCCALQVILDPSRTARFMFTFGFVYLFIYLFTLPLGGSNVCEVPQCSCGAKPGTWLPFYLYSAFPAYGLFIHLYFFFELCVASALCEPPQQSSGGPAKPPLEPKWISSLNTHNSKTCL